MHCALRADAAEAEAAEALEEYQEGEEGLGSGEALDAAKSRSSGDVKGEPGFRIEFMRRVQLLLHTYMTRVIPVARVARGSSCVPALRLGLAAALLLVILSCLLP